MNPLRGILLAVAFSLAVWILIVYVAYRVFW